jgi:hypothetical protein
MSEEHVGVSLMEEPSRSGLLERTNGADVEAAVGEPRDSFVVVNGIPR